MKIELSGTELKLTLLAYTEWHKGSTPTGLFDDSDPVAYGMETIDKVFSQTPKGYRIDQATDRDALTFDLPKESLHHMARIVELGLSVATPFELGQIEGFVRRLREQSRI